MASYTIIGADHKHYGSVSADSVRLWIGEGRLNAQSLLKAEGELEFRPLETFPEFADALAAKTAPAPPPPLPSDAAAMASVRTSGLAITSLVLGIVAIATCGILLLIAAPVGLILGLVSMNQIRKSQGQLKGRGLALAGVIISCVALLLIPVFAALLLPALAQAKQKAETTRCVNNVKQLSVALCICGDDNQGHYPVATNWCGAVQGTGVSSQIFHCPADNSGSRCSYAYNAKLAGVEETKANPNTVMIFEAGGGWNASGGPELLLDKPRHGHAVVVGFADGHVEIVPDSQLSQLRWNP